MRKTQRLPLTFPQAIEIVIRLKKIDSQYIALAEECGELLVAASHRRRKRVSRAKFIEELADVQMMIEEFKLIEKITPQEFEKMYNKKLRKFYKQVTELVNAELPSLFNK